MKRPKALAPEKLRFALVALAGFVAALLAVAPASVASFLLTRSAPMLSISGAGGTVWRGKLSGVSYGGMAVGDIDYRLRALPLLLGRADIEAKSAGGALLGRARMTLAPGSVDLRDVNAEFNLGAIRQYTFFGVRYQGLLRLEAERLRLTRAGCSAEQATLSTTAFEALSRQWSGGPFPMAGAITCRDGAMNAALVGEGADGKANVGVSIGPDFTYSMRVAAEPRRQDVSRALQQFGFEKKGEALSYEAAGVLKGLSS